MATNTAGPEGPVNRAKPAPPMRPDDVARMENSLFSPPIQPDIQAPTVNAEDLANGVIAQLVGTRVVEFKHNGEPRKAKLWTFAAIDGSQHFALFGSAQLDSQLAKVKAGAAMMLKYLGKVEATDGSGRTAHTWEVRQTNANRAQLAQLLSSPEWKARTEQLELAISQAAQRDQERRAARSSQGGAESGPGMEAPPDGWENPFV